MKKFMIVPLVLLLTACGNVASNTQVKDDTKITQGTEIKGEIDGEKVTLGTDINWIHDGGLNTNVKSLMSDYVRAMFKSGFSKDWNILGYDIDVMEASHQNKKYMVDFTLNMHYNNYELIPNNGDEAQTFENGNELQTMSFELRFLANENNGLVDPESFKLEQKVTGEGIGGDEFTTAETILPDTNDYFGEMTFEGDELVLSRELWVEETNGYTPNGFFITSYDSVYRFKVDENAEVSYMKDSVTADSMPIDEFMKANDTEGRVYNITLENGVVKYIIEVFRP